ncbi:MAG: endonuclease/exonuclease/phosphatase family protein [Bacteroidales bacterium]|nr:endonuclease/exonuclease/phosphatase family protein [Bacteroidales bacterium]
MKKLLFRIILITNIVFAALLIVSGLSVYISPERIWYFAFLGLIFPYILIINILFLVFWAILRKYGFLISLVVILLCWKSAARFIQLNICNSKPPADKTVVKLLSYNVRLFNYYNWLNIKSVPEDILAFIQKEEAGLVCLQEFLTLEGSRFSEDSIKKMLHLNPYSHIYYTNVASNKKSLGIATYSSYPIINKGIIKFTGTKNACIFSDIRINEDTVRIYNCHLQSTQLQKDDYHFLDSIIFNYSPRHILEFKNISYRLKHAYLKRARQVETLSRHINSSPYSCMVCGDFNDTPVSYTYYKLRGRLKDAYLESGTGIGNTYFGHFPSFRIDYILHSKSINTLEFKTKKIRLSDHFPIICYFYLKDEYI